MEAPLPPDEAQRLAALYEYELLDTAAEQEYDDITRAVSFLFGTPMSLVSLVAADRQYLKSKVGISLTELPRNSAFCAHAILGRTPMVVNDATLDPRFRNNPLVVGPMGVRFYAAAPLVTPQGHAVGTLGVIDTRPRQVSPEALEHLAALARQVVRNMELRRTIVSLRGSVEHLTHARAALETARCAAVAATEAKSAFLANMSHEIRTPMAAILGLTDLMLSPASAPSDPIACLQTIRRQGDHLMSILNDILDLSKIEAGRMTVGNVPCNLMQILNDIAALTGPRAVEKGLTFTVLPSADLPAVVHTDPTRLRQILLNLLSNAVKFTAAGSVTLRVASSLLEGDEHRVTFSVIDTGIGLSPEQQRELFQPFVQADTSATRAFGGTGLGLVISKRLAQALGGDVTLASAVGQGSTVTATIIARAVDSSTPTLTTLPCTSTTAIPTMEAFHALPLAPLGPQPVVAKPLPPVVTPPATAASIHKGTRGRVLLAEDDETLQMLTAVHLRRAGFEVVLADNGKQACDHVAGAAATPFDLILMDMQMPVLDGYAAVTQLRRAGYARPIIALTADAMAHQRASIVASGCDDCLTKPLNTQALHRLLDRFVPPANAATRVA
jgi:signal transduction histidine kinase/CheY-like chemotaxis protein